MLRFNNLIIQWGNFPETSGYDNTNTFPISFTSQYFIGVAQQKSSYSISYSGGWINNWDGSLTNFGAGVGNDVTAGDPTTLRVEAIFIGI